MNNTTSNMLDAALLYADLGYKVMPCAPGSKRPLTAHGLKDATDDLDQIEVWWTKWPDANIAITTDGMLVVDIDGKDNPWLRDDLKKQDELANAPRSLTANDGQQCLFGQPEGKHWRNTAGKLAPNVDTRANGGYIVVPPSVLDGDKHYRWAPSFELEVGPEQLPEPPDWLIAQLDEMANGGSAPTLVETDGNNIPSGQRNATLASLGGTMRRVGMAQDEIVAALRQVNDNRCKPPLPGDEVEHIAGSVARYEPDQIATAVAENHWDQQFGETIDPPSVRELMDKHPALRKPVIHGLLREGETMNVISAPKRGKSWLVTDLALSVATGRPWLDTYQTEPGEVLILDNELHGETSANRIPKVADARGIPLDAYADRLFVQNLRGQLRDVYTLGAFFDALEPERFKIIILDAFYRFMPRQMDENDNGTMASLYNHIDRYADRLKCCFVLIHHTTKGNQSGKSVTDVGAGAGSQSRATDTHLVLRPHEEEDAVVLDAAVRSWPPVSPQCLEWAFPVWSPADHLDPTQLRSEKGKKRGETKHSPESFVEAFVGPTPQERTAILNKAVQAGLSHWAADRLLRTAHQAGLIVRQSSGRRNEPFSYHVASSVTNDVGVI